MQQTIDGLLEQGARLEARAQALMASGQKRAAAMAKQSAESYLQQAVALEASAKRS